MSTDEIAVTYGLREHDSIPVSQLPDLSLALVQQMVGNYCVTIKEEDIYDRYKASDLESKISHCV